LVKGSSGTRWRRLPLRRWFSIAFSRSINSVRAPCSATFRPLRSLSASTRRPPPRCHQLSSGHATSVHQTPQAAMPSNCTPTCCSRDSPVPMTARSPNRPTASVPQAPAARCAGMAPTASSMRQRSSFSLHQAMASAPAAPVSIACAGDTACAPAVIATSPAIRPLIRYITS